MKRLALVCALTFASPAFADSSQYDWTGFYAGATAGTGDVEFSLGSNRASADSSGFGLVAGYNYDLGTWVAGGEVSYDNGDISASAASGSLDYTTSRIAAKAGYEVGQALVFGTLGWATTEVSNSAGSGEVDGMSYGLGIDYLLNDNIILGADYVMDSYDDIPDSGGTDMDTGTFRLRAAYRF